MPHLLAVPSLFAIDTRIGDIRKNRSRCIRSIFARFFALKPCGAHLRGICCIPCQFQQGCSGQTRSFHGSLGHCALSRNKLGQSIQTGLEQSRGSHQPLLFVEDTMICRYIHPARPRSTECSIRAAPTAPPHAVSRSFAVRTFPLEFAVQNHLDWVYS